MRRHDKRQTDITFTQRIGREHGFEVSREDAGYILWNHTGYPSFWDGDPIECLDRQVTEFFQKANHDSA